ncbi:hypothetical protein SAY86_014744 [Trapa natans]|uniref:BZIP domain-containing protein n=1 Tax=Trapa natans TaxID=22666 RepID=A0AAN7KDL6_TRANT|nr:hypothetical protein SAY86_014744 [Trapa natans]
MEILSECSPDHNVTPVYFTSEPFFLPYSTATPLATDFITTHSFNNLLLPDLSALTFAPEGRDRSSQNQNCIPLVVARNNRRLRRMISNRESARRSRLRKKKQIEELQCQVEHLRATNHHLSEKLIGLLEANQHFLQENTDLKEKLTSLQVIVSDLLAPFKGPEDVPSCTNFLKL